MALFPKQIMDFKESYIAGVGPYLQKPKSKAPSNVRDDIGILYHNCTGCRRM